MQNAPIRLTFIKLPFVIKIFVLSIFEWPFYTGFTVLARIMSTLLNETNLQYFQLQIEQVVLTRLYVTQANQYLCRSNMVFSGYFIFSGEPVHEISNNGVCATSKGSEQPVHMRSLIRAFARRLNIV